MWSNMLRWVRVRGVREGKMQVGRVEGLKPQGRDDCQRPQDYGFAALAVDGEGLALEIGGHTVIIRQDRLAERPSLAAYEVCVWHKDGHKVTLKDGGKIQVDCTTFEVNASTSATFNTPNVFVNGNQAVSQNQTVAGNQGVGGNSIVTGNSIGMGTITAPTVIGSDDVLASGHSGKGHRHGNVQHGGDVSDPPT